MKKLERTVFILILMILISGVTVFAVEDIRVMEVQDTGEIPVVFIKGIENVQSAEALIGNIEASKVQIKEIEQENISIRTLVLLDNSLSIPEKDRNKVKNIVEELIASRSSQEQFSIATFGEEIEVLIEFTDDYVNLKEIINSIEFKDRETYLTDVLYDLISSDYFEYEKGNIYSRIFVISDGVDNKSLGYTAEELGMLLSEQGVPIYSLGVYNRKKSNSEELKAMFSISRQTNAECFLLDEIEDNMSIASELAKDRDIVRFDIIPSEESMDGSKKTIQIHIQDSNGVVTVHIDNVRMKQKVAEAVTVMEEVIEESTEVISEKNVEEGTNKTFIIIAMAAIILIICIVCIVIGKLVKKKKRDNIVRETEVPFVEKGYDTKTEFIGNDYSVKSSGETVLLFNDNNDYMITLTDIMSPAKSFRKKINDKIVIGRSTNGTDICIDYDQSVSGKHCIIERRGNKFYLIDLQSRNKTYLNDTQVLSEVEISSGNIIKMGRVKMRVEMS